MDKIKAFKGFDENLRCRDFQFEVGKTYEHAGKVKACSSGFHACKGARDVLSYYPVDLKNRYCEVEVWGTVEEHPDDSKVATQFITVLRELTLVEFLTACATVVVPDTAAAGDDSTLAAAGEYSTLAAAGNASTLAAAGERSNLAAAGDYSKLAAVGNDSKLAAAGHGSKLAAAGEFSNLAAAGNDSTLAAAGYRSNLAASGANSTIMAAGLNSTAKAGPNGCIVLAWYDGARVRSVTGYVGEDGIEADTWYRVNNTDGALVLA